MKAVSERDGWKMLFNRVRARTDAMSPLTRDTEERAPMTARKQSGLGIREARLLEMMQSDIALERIAPGLPQRLHAARLCAGFPNAESAAFAARVDGRLYRSVENGTRKPSFRIVEAAEKAFDVSLEYLLLAVPYRPVDLEAVGVEATITALKAGAWSDAKTIGNRLKDRRRMAGFKSADEALARFDWKPSAYKSHEAGFTPIPLDRLVIYARAYGVDACDLAMPSLDVEPHLPPVDRPAPQSRPTPRDPPWPWLTQAIVSADVMTMQVLTLNGDGKIVPARFGLTMPADGSRVPFGSAFYAVLATDARTVVGRDYLILQPYQNEPDVNDLVVSEGWRIRSGVPATDHFEQTDPLTIAASSERPVVLGRLIGKVTLRWGG